MARRFLGFLAGSMLFCAVAANHESVKVKWLEGSPDYYIGATFGLPWPEGKYFLNKTEFTIAGDDGTKLSLQSWATGYWRDGSLKWTGHAIPESDTIFNEYKVTPSTSSMAIPSFSHEQHQSLKIRESKGRILVKTGKISVVFPKKGPILVDSIRTAAGKVVGRKGKLVLHSQSDVAAEVSSRPEANIDYFNFESNVEKVSASTESTTRAVITVRGKHRVANGGGHRDWLPFVVRFYLYANSDSIRIVHSITFDGKAEEDFITGLGINFQVPLKDEELYDRHIRMAGVSGGFLHESVLGVSGLSKDPGEEVTSAQFNGSKTPELDEWNPAVVDGIQYIPTWADYKLSQLSPDGFNLMKRTKPGQSWVKIPGGTRSEGLLYFGGATKGGLAIGLRDFWQRYPTGMDISKATSDHGEMTLWLYSPDAPPLDLRQYHDGLGEKTYEQQLAGLAVTYEDFEPGFDTPYGIARTSEVYLHAFDHTPTSDHLALLSKHLQQPPMLVAAEPAYTLKTKAMGTYWGLPDTSSEKSKTLEEHLDFLLGFYEDQRNFRRWYGFLDYGDFMHTYDQVRHTWRYDNGGFAWDNSELSPDLFYWQFYLRSGRADVYRFAEALTRHTSEVDAYHLGDWKGLGTRHGIQHWSDSAKQVRVNQPQYRKYFFYISGGDERMGELLDDALDTDQTYGILDPQRKVRTDGFKPKPGQPTAVVLGLDWAGLAAGWLIEWERRGPRWEEARSKLTGTATGIANLTNGFVTGSGLYVIDNGTMLPPPADPDNKGLVAISHLDSVFGLPELMSEMLEYWGEDAPEGLKEAWLDYCYFYDATPEEQKARYGEAFSGINLLTGHSRLTAYWAHEHKNVTAAQRAWREFYDNEDGHDGLPPDAPWKTEVVNGSKVLVPTEEALWIQSSNAVAQYGLAVIQNLAYIADSLAKSPYP